MIVYTYTCAWVNSRVNMYVNWFLTVVPPSCTLALSIPGLVIALSSLYVIYKVVRSVCLCYSDILYFLIMFQVTGTLATFTIDSCL